MITLVVTLASPTRIRASKSFDVTHPRAWDDSATGPSQTQRRFAGQRHPGDRVTVSVLVDGRPRDGWQWNGNHSWPRESGAAIIRARCNPAA